MDELVYFKGGPWNGRVERMPDVRDTWVVPSHGSLSSINATLLPQPIVYRRTRPMDYERVLTEDVIMKKGTLLADFTLPWGWVVVFRPV